MLRIGDVSGGFTVEEEADLPEIDGRALVMRHALGTRLLWLANDDANKAFSIAFRTPPADDTGVFHILEHSVLCGSDRFPVKEPFVNLLRTSMQTFLNAMTFSDKTMYPVASTNEQDLLNLMDVYLDAVLHPAIYRDPHIFAQEGWHYELGRDGDAAEDVLTYNGVVFNEMKGALADPEDVLYHEVGKRLFPGTCYAWESGGHPRSIPTLTYERFLDAHARHYRLDQAYIVLYGDLDIHRVLGFLDERYLAGWEPRTQAAPNPMGQCAPAVAPDAVVEMDTAPENACVGWGLAVGPARDFERVLAADVLMDALMGGNESPIKRAVLDADLGGDCSGYLLDGQAVPSVLFVLRNARPGAADEFRRVIAGEAARLVREGIPRDVLEASLAQLSFSLRERDRGVADGVALAVNAMAGWLYDEDGALTYLRFEEPMARLRAGLDDGLFERLLDELVVRNGHAALVDIVPKEAPEGLEEAELAAALAGMDDEAKQAVRDELNALRARQEAPDVPEALAALPQLHVSDIGPARPDPPLQEMRTASGLTCLYHDVPTRGIAYFYAYFDLRCVAFEDMPYVRLLCLLLGSLDTQQRTAAELDSHVRTHLGRLSFFTDLHVRDDDPDDVRPTLAVSASALVEELPALAAIPREVWGQTRFDDAERIRDLLVQKRVSMEQSFMGEGHAHAANRAASGLFASGVLNEQLGGVGFYRFLCALIDDFDARFEGLRAKLADLAAAVFRADGCVTSFTGAPDARDAFWGHAGDLGLATGSAPRVLAIPQPQVRREAFIVPGDVVYVVKAADVGPAWPVRGEWVVLSSALSFDYLWNEVRVKGGAYGSGFRRTPMGYARFHSYRDPHIDETLARYDAAADWLAAFDPTPDEMEGYIVSTVAGHDAPVKPRAVARRQDAAWFAGRPADHRERIRAQVLACTPAALAGMADALRLVADSPCVCVFGSEEVIRAAQTSFDSVEVLFG